MNETFAKNECCQAQGSGIAVATYRVSQSSQIGLREIWRNG